MNGQTFEARLEDVKFVLDELGRLNKEQGSLQGKLDLSRIAMSGHSYGANTSMTMAGQRYGVSGREQSFADARVKCAIYLSAPVVLRGRSPQEVFGGIKIPGLLMTGTEDNSPVGDTTAAMRRLPFDGMTGPNQYLVIFNGGDHMLFAGAVRRQQTEADARMLPEIERVTTAFLDAYLNGDKSAKQWLNTETSKYLGQDATFERK
jgi:predicted dienelactone hydrolase